MRMVAKVPSVPECVVNLLVEKVKRIRHLYAFCSGSFFRRSIRALVSNGITPGDLVDRPETDRCCILGIFQ